MKRALRLGSFWNWLPAFRAVAETEHLPTASDDLRISASALSRTIRLLEGDIGQPLFDRVGRAIRLNATGSRFLGAVRDAMRIMDEGLQAIESRQFLGTVTISVPGPFAAIFVLPALPALQVEHPGLLAVINSFPTPDVCGALKRGEIDIAITDEPTPDAHLAIEALADIRHGLYCGATHPLADAGAVGLDVIAKHRFVAPTKAANGGTPDRWPPHWERTIGVRVTHLETGIEAVLSGDFLGVLPEPVATRAGLVEVATPAGIPPTTLYLMQRSPLPVVSRSTVVAEALRALVAAS